MTRQRDLERFIQIYLEEGPRTLPTRSYDTVRTRIDHIRQRVVIGPWKEEQMSRFAMIAISAAAVVLLAVIGIRFLPTGGGVGGQATSAPTSTPAEVSTPQGTPMADPNGQLAPGRYVAHPFNTLLGVDARAFTFDVPSANWEAFGDGQGVGPEDATTGVAWNDGSGSSRGVGVGFVKVDSLNSDACHWTTDQDIEFGPTVDDMLGALASATTFEGGADPYTEYVSNVTGQGVELVMPSTLLDNDVNCDDQSYKIWNASGFDIHAQGPSNTWRLGIFDVGGERYIVLASFMPDTPEEVLNEMMSIFRSVAID